MPVNRMIAGMARSYAYKIMVVFKALLNLVPSVMHKRIVIDSLSLHEINEQFILERKLSAMFLPLIP